VSIFRNGWTLSMTLSMTVDATLSMHSRCASVSMLYERYDCTDSVGQQLRPNHREISRAHGK